MTQSSARALLAALKVSFSRIKGDGVNVQIDRRRRQQSCWKATEPWHREPEAGVITAWLAAACTCAGRSMAGSLAGLLTCSPIVHQRHARACSKSSTTALFGPTAARGQQSSVLRAMAMGQMLATTHGQSYRAQSLWCEGVGGLWNCPLMTPYTARGFCHAVVSTLPLPGVITVYCNYSCNYL